MRCLAFVPRACACLLALVALASCAREHRILDDGCELTDERSIGELLGPSPHDVVLVGGDTPTHVAWSERAGLFVRALDTADAPIVRMGPACDAGLAADQGLIACSRRGDDAKAQPGSVTVLDIEADAIVDVVHGVGPDSFGVSLAVLGPARSLAWNDARGTTSSVAMQRDRAEPQRISREGVRAGRPAVRFDRSGAEPHLVMVWPETWPGEDGVEGVLRALSDRRALDLEPLAYDEAHPTIALDEQGAAVVVLRDRRPSRTRPRLFLRRFGRSEVAHEGVFANAEGEAIAVPCAGALVVVAPRTHSRSERLVAVRRHDLVTLEGSGPEHQIYLHGAAFDHADARCVGRDLIIAVASRATIERPRGEVSTVRFACPEEAP